jgi:cell division protein FtsA
LPKIEIQKSGYAPACAAGIVLTGGSSMMKDLAEMSEEVLQLPVRIGAPSNIKGLCEKVDTPKYATAVGLIKYGISSSLETTFLKNANPESIFSNVSKNFKKLIKNFFDLF